MGASVNDVLADVKEKAPTALAAWKHLPTEETTQSAQCRACDNVLHCPLMLPCEHHLCADCLYIALQQTGRIVCPDCQAHHPLTTTSVIRPPPLLLDLLADQVAECGVCKKPVQLKHMNEHTESGCMLYLHLTPEHIIKTPTNSPLSKVEERVGSNLVRRWLCTSGSNEVTVPTGGQVHVPVHVYTSHIMYMYIHTYCNSNRITGNAVNDDLTVRKYTVHKSRTHNYCTYAFQPLKIVKITSPRGESCSERTTRRRVHEMSQCRAVITSSISSSSSLLEREITTLAKAERQALLQGAGVVVNIPPEEGLAMKADLALPWSRMRDIRRLEPPTHTVII